jgi:Flp pilus assembly protein TadG
MEEKNYFFSAPTLILLSIGFVALLGFAFFAFEGGRIYVERQELQRYATETARALCAESSANSERVVATQNDGKVAALANDITVYRPPISGTFAGNKDYLEVTVSGVISGGLVDLASAHDVLVTSQAVVYCGSTVTEISSVDASQ